MPIVLGGNLLPVDDLITHLFGNGPNGVSHDFLK